MVRSATMSSHSAKQVMIANDRISRVIFDYAAKIGAAQGLDAVLQLNAGMARDLVGADRCSIWLVDLKCNRLWTKVAHGVPELHIPIGQGLVGACVSRNEAIMVNDTSRDERFLKSVDKESGYVTKSVLTLPLCGMDGKPMGALQLLNKPGGFSQDDVDLLGLCSAYSASTLESQRMRKESEMAQLILQELEIAREVQQHLLPQGRPEISGLDFAGYCRSAKFVGGDYYDFLPMRDGGFLFTLGDVSGKGIAAAVLMASIQASLRSQVVRPPDSLAAMMGDFNKAVYSFSTADKYSTLFCGLLDVASLKLTYVNAGQVRPMLLRCADGQVERLESGGLPVGLLEVSEYEQGEVLLQPGDAVLCFSDGISEATNANELMWDESEVQKVVQACRGLRAQDMIDRLVEATDGFAGEAEQADDMTVVAVRTV
jgi:sigma-B regulation protein RsbU (phosphoserine phosphatase)